eukprot:g53501.t1
MLAQLVGFIAYNLARVHNKRGVRAEDYDTLGQALLMAIKASLGNDYSERMCALLIAVLPWVDQTRTIYIRLAKWNPELGADPVVRQAVKSSKPEKKAGEKGCAIMYNMIIPMTEPLLLQHSHILPRDSLSALLDTKQSPYILDMNHELMHFVFGFLHVKLSLEASNKAQHTQLQAGMEREGSAESFLLIALDQYFCHHSSSDVS